MQNCSVCLLHKMHHRRADSPPVVPVWSRQLQAQQADFASRYTCTLCKQTMRIKADLLKSRLQLRQARTRIRDPSPRIKSFDLVLPSIRKNSAIRPMYNVPFSPLPPRALTCSSRPILPSPKYPQSATGRTAQLDIRAEQR